MQHDQPRVHALRRGVRGTDGAARHPYPINLQFEIFSLQFSISVHYSKVE
jgi:hypothetical protein